MKKSKILIYNIHPDDLFNWLIDHVYESYGDGAGAVVCSNYSEAFHYFRCYFIRKYPKYANYYTIIKYNDSIHMRDGDESFIFTNNENINFFEKDYLFIVKEDCISFDKKVKLTAI